MKKKLLVFMAMLTVISFAFLIAACNGGGNSDNNDVVIETPCNECGEPKAGCTCDSDGDDLCFECGESEAECTCGGGDDLCPECGESEVECTCGGGDDLCPECGEPEDECTCEDVVLCPDCGEPEDECTCGSGGTTVDPNFHIFLCFGQSNMQGDGGVPIEHRTWTNDRFRVMHATNEPQTASTRQVGQWYTAVPPLGVGTGLTPADFFGRTLVERITDTNVKIGVIIVSVPGAGIATFQKGSSVIRSEYGGKNAYDRLIEMANLAQEDGVIKGILMHQGESGANLTTWPVAVKGIYDDLLSDLGLQPNSIPFLAGETSRTASNAADLLAAVRNLAVQYPTFHVVSSEGCEMRSDNIHFSINAGIVKLGTRYGNKMFDVFYKDENYVPGPLEKITPGGSGVTLVSGNNYSLLTGSQPTQISLEIEPYDAIITEINWSIPTQSNVTLVSSQTSPNDVGLAYAFVQGNSATTSSVTLTITAKTPNDSNNIVSTIGITVLSGEKVLFDGSESGLGMIVSNLTTWWPENTGNPLVLVDAPSGNGKKAMKVIFNATTNTYALGEAFAGNDPTTALRINTTLPLTGYSGMKIYYEYEKGLSNVDFWALSECMLIMAGTGGGRMNNARYYTAVDQPVNNPINISFTSGANVTSPAPANWIRGTMFGGATNFTDIAAYKFAFRFSPVNTTAGFGNATNAANNIINDLTFYITKIELYVE